MPRHLIAVPHAALRISEESRCDCLTVVIPPPLPFHTLHPLVHEEKSMDWHWLLCVLLSFPQFPSVFSLFSAVFCTFKRVTSNTKILQICCVCCLCVCVCVLAFACFCVCVLKLFISSLLLLLLALDLFDAHSLIFYYPLILFSFFYAVIFLVEFSLSTCTYTHRQRHRQPHRTRGLSNTD